MRVLDSHLHLWDPEVLDYPWLSGPLAYAFGDIELENARIDGATAEEAIFVQADCRVEQYVDEVRWVDELASRIGVRGIVAGVQLEREGETVRQLDALSAYERVVGVRHLLQGEADGFALAPSFVLGAQRLAARGWSFDACVRGTRQLADVSELAARVPELRIVLDHVGKPEVGTAASPLAPSADWVAGITALAAHPQVFCKVSGLPAEAGGDWNEAQVEPFLDAAATAFGPGRLIWGSDWPVSVIGPAEEGDPYAPADGSPTYQFTARTRWAHAVSDWAVRRGYDADAIMGENARSFYRVR